MMDALKQCGVEELGAPPTGDDQTAAWIDATSRLLANARRIVMPNEFGRNQPDVRFLSGDSGARIEMSYRKSMDFEPLEKGKMKAAMAADGYTRSIMVPYLGTNVTQTWRGAKF